MFKIDEKLSVLCEMGDTLDSLDNVEERNGIGFNRLDKMRWGVVRGNATLMARMLKKYRKQLDSRGFNTEFFSQIDQGPAAAILNDNGGIVVRVGPARIPRFDAFLSAVKGAGLRFDGETKSWFASPEMINRIDVEKLRVGLADAGLEVWTDEQFRGYKKEDPKKYTIKEALTCLERNIPIDCVVIRRLPDSLFEIRFSYNHQLVELFKNNAGKISGITNYNPVTKARETYDVMLVMEIIEKVKDLGIDVLTEGVDQAYAEFMKRKEAAKNTPPEVLRYLDKAFTLMPFQNEGVMTLLEANGRLLLGDDPGCISGDALVHVNRCGKGFKIKFKDLHSKFHGNSRWNKKFPTYAISLNEQTGVFFKNKIHDVLSRGVKKVLEIKIRSKSKTYKLKLTEDHEVFTSDGYVRADKLSIGSLVATNGKKYCSTCKKYTDHSTYKYSKFLGECRVCIYRILRKNTESGMDSVSKSDGYVYVHGMFNHPRSNARGRTLKHILSYEAYYLNEKMNLNVFIDKIKKNEIKGLKFLEKNLNKHVHHKDGDRANYDPLNLELITASDHNVEHLKIAHIKSMVCSYSKVVSIKEMPPEEVYDLIVEDPHRNFLTNGIVVHNCGKTLQTLAFVVAKETSVLVVCPKVVKRNWLKEAKKFFPGYFNDLNSIELSSKNKSTNLNGIKIATINYESLGAIKDSLRESGIETLVVDESHKIKNENTLNYQNVFSIKDFFKYRILLSGTAVKNKKEDIYTQATLIDENVFESKSEVKGMTIGAAWKKISPFYLSRRKANVLKDLPPKMTQIVDLDVKNAPKVPQVSTREEIMRIKHELAIAKVDATVSFIQELLDSGDNSMLVFTDSKEAAEMLHEKLKGDSVLHHGQMSTDHREKLKENWQNLTIKERVFITTRQSLEVGANMPRADRVIFNDLPWTPADIIQAEDRAHRAVGTVNPVIVFWIVAASHAFDQRLTNLLKKKYDLCKKMNEGKQLSKADSEWMNKSVAMDELVGGL